MLTQNMTSAEAALRPDLLGEAAAMTSADWLLLMFCAVIIAFGIVAVLELLNALLFIRHQRRATRRSYERQDKHTLASTTDEEDALFASIKRNTCPDCKGQGFYAGPSGGMTQNIYCMNARCCSAFNVASFGGGAGWCERIGKAEFARYPISTAEKEAIEKEEAEAWSPCTACVTPMDCGSWQACMCGPRS